MRRVWGAVVLQVPRDREEEIAGLLVGDGLGVGVEPAPAGRVWLRIFVGSRAEAAAALPQINRLLSRAGCEPASCEARVEAVRDEGWVERYRASMAPFPLGRRFEVFPADGIVRAGRQALHVPPSRAFGTGEHPTTQLCAECLEVLVQGGSPWLDLGCGTAILALVAYHCGASRVLALDIDAGAIAVARETLQRNGSPAIELARGSIETAGDGWAGVVANLHAPFFLDSAERLYRALAVGGRLIASGFLAEDLEPIAARLVRAGLREEQRRLRGEWAVLVLRKGGRPGPVGKGRESRAGGGRPPVV